MSDQHQGLVAPAAAAGRGASEVNHVSQLSQDLAHLCRSEEFCDVVLSVEGHRFSAHRAVLAARSEYFRALLFGGMKESREKEVTLTGAAVGPFRVLLQYIYTGQMSLVGLKEDTVLDMLGLAHQYGFTQLEEAVSQYLEAAVRAGNVCVIYDMARLYRQSALLDVCQSFMDKNAAAVLQHPSFCTMSDQGVREVISRDSFCAAEVDIFRAVSRWTAANPELDSAQLLAAVRLPLVSMQDLVNVVRPSGVISPDAILDAIKTKVESRDRELPYRGCLLPDENVCTPRHGAQTVRGDMRSFLLNGDTSAFDMERGFTRHAIDDACSDNCIEVRLGMPCIINHIKMLLWDKDMRSYSYYVEVSMDECDWVRVVNHSRYHCRSWQTLYFPPRVVRSIRVVGTNNTVNKMFHLVSLEASYCSRPEPTENGLIVPRENVATLQRSAMVIEGVSRSRNALLNGDTDKYDWDHGYTCHQLGSGSVVVQLGQPVLLDSMRMLLWDCDDRTYGYYIEVSTNQRDWTIVCDRSRSHCRSWQVVTFKRRPVVFIRIVGTRNSANEVFHCVHFECPAQCEVERHTDDPPVPEAAEDEPEDEQEGAAGPQTPGAVGGERRFSFELELPAEEAAAAVFGDQCEP
ncbi:BTB/POZ domain-containing protein 9-like [Amphibalanus amphitrite]|uniref:BTB/POZ domain-containing protein 9-like n=1 Tax=Amphibalanus amphitrite TaxID=1232801 RepID=UPI001C9073FE|nr:BTB/POZ domain-containing protein 9-like [Amphibalanus amphitrite]XP_043193008.1 BTB/POZ domain-containing protein 9-like [Amphibalanus amphitrite]XP_043193009.1 BTB/POZ domain-containing protein 9-like [Amphibalanus amphitrite]